jgi:hypothetical protein
MEKLERKNRGIFFQKTFTILNLLVGVTLVFSTTRFWIYQCSHKKPCPWDSWFYIIIFQSKYKTFI